jgi:hypothetical protein
MVWDHCRGTVSVLGHPLGISIGAQNWTESIRQLQLLNSAADDIISDC